MQPAHVEAAGEIFSIPVCNQQQLKQFCRSIGAGAAFGKLVDGFINEMEGFAAGLAELGQDPERLGFAAHKMKAVAGYLGAARLATICERVEEAARRAPRELTRGMLDQLEKTVVLSIEAYRGAQPNA